MSESQLIQLSGGIYVGNIDQAKVIYLVLAALGWKGRVSMVVEDGDTVTTSRIDTSLWGLES